MYQGGTLFHNKGFMRISCQDYELHLQFAVIIISLTAMLLSLQACKGPTSIAFGSIRGVVSVDIGDDQSMKSSNVAHFKVAIYKPEITDTTLVRLTDLYQHDTFIDYSYANFDHRTSNPLMVVNPEANGFFEFPKVPEGSYNLVVIQEGWSAKYVYGIRVIGDQVSVLDSIIISQAIIVPSYLGSDYVFESGTTYVFLEDTVIAADVEVEEDVLFLVNAGKTLRLYGTITCPSIGYWKIDSLDSFYAIDIIDSIDCFNGLFLYGECVSISNLVLCNTISGLSANSHSFSLTCSIVRGEGSSIASSNGNLFLSNTVIYGGSSIAVQVVGGSGESRIQNSLFVNSYNALSIFTEGQSIIEDCYFYDNHYAIRTTSSTGVITNNEFDQNYQDIVMERSSFNVVYNNFHFCELMSVYPGSSGGNLQSVVNNNNFFSTNRYFISIGGGAPSYTCVIRDLDATSNYWRPEYIDDYLFDSTDNGTTNYPPCPYSIIYAPRRGSIVLTAGINNGEKE